MKSSTLLTVAICTHNRSDMIKRCLDALVNQTKQQNNVVVTIVDNASNQSHQSKLKQLTQSLKIELIHEPKIGLSHARNAALKHTQSKYIAYIDDDAIPNPKWLENIVNVITKEPEKYAMIGGPIEPIWETPKPKWLTKNLYTQFSILPSSQNESDEITTQKIFGTNMVLNVQKIISLGCFPTTLGRKGTTLISCEEVFIRKLLEQNNEHVYFDKNIQVQHHISNSRINKKWLIKRSFWQGYSKFLMNKELEHKKINTIRSKKTNTFKLIIKQFKTIQPLYYLMKVSILMGQIFAWINHNRNKQAS